MQLHQSSTILLEQDTADKTNWNFGCWIKNANLQIPVKPC